MKKFLTVLLVIAVMFTFSFSSAFAVTPSADKITDALAYVQSVYGTAKSTVSDNGEQAYSGSGWDVSAENWLLAYEVAYNNLVTAVAGVTNATADTAADVLVAAGVTGASGSDAAIKAAIVDYLAKASTGATYQPAAATPALVAQLEAEKAEAIVKVNSVDTSIYSTKEYTSATASATYLWAKYSYVTGTALTAGDAHYVAKEVADSILAGVIDGINEISTADLGTASIANSGTAAGYHANLNTLFNAYVLLNGDDGDGIEEADETWTYTLKSVGGKDPLTVAVEESSEASNAANVATKKATIASNIATHKATSGYLALTGNAKVARDKYLDAYRTAQTYLVENVSTHTVAGIDTGVDLAPVVAKAAEAIEEVEELKAETNADGTAKYSATKLDANLKIVLTELYSYDNSTHTTATYSTANLVGTNVGAFTGVVDATVSYVMAVDKANYKGILKGLMDDDDQSIDYQLTGGYIATGTGAVTYYDLEWAAVKSAADAYFAAVDAATTTKDITDAAAAFKKAMDKIDADSVVLAYYTSNKLESTTDAEFTKLNAYAASLTAEHGASDPLVFDITDITGGAKVETGADGTLIAFYIDKGARTKEEITALYNDAKAVLDGAKTVSTLKAEAQAVVNQIAALPAKNAVTLADKDAIAAAYGAYDNLNASVKVYVTNYSALTGDITAVKKAEMDGILKAVKALPISSAVTVEDKAAVEAVADMIKAYNNTEMYKLPSAYTNPTVTNLLNTIRGKELDAVKAAAKAIPATSKLTAEDKATVEAARKAYDEFISNYGEELTGAELTALQAQEAKIAAAEEALVPLMETEDEAVKTLLADVTAKTSSAKVSKGIKVTVKADVSELEAAGYTVEYKFYRSTKKASGYVYKMTSKTGSYTNTAGKKGVKYYYKAKLVVKNAAGEVVAETPLKQSTYACRTWTK